MKHKQSHSLLLVEHSCWQQNKSNSIVDVSLQQICMPPTCTTVVNTTYNFATLNNAHIKLHGNSKTQPSILCGMVMQIPPFALSNDKWQWWTKKKTIASYRWTHSPRWLTWSEGQQPLRKWCCSIVVRWTGWTRMVTCPGPH